MRGISAALLVAVTVAVVVAAGCGGSSNDAAGTTTVVVTETTSADTASTDTMSTDTTTTDTTSTDTTAVDTTALSGLSEGCQKVADFSVAFGKAIGQASANGSENDLEASAKAYETAANNVPEDIRPAFKTLAAAYVKYAAAIQGLDLKQGQVPDAATIAKLAKAAQELGNQDLTKANADITAWVTKNCSATG